jgi:hypothetical protein
MGIHKTGQDRAPLGVKGGATRVLVLEVCAAAHLENPTVVHGDCSIRDNRDGPQVVTSQGSLPEWGDHLG